VWNADDMRDSGSTSGMVILVLRCLPRPVIAREIAREQSNVDLRPFSVDRFAA
jgi:hypothetical protein